MKQEFNEHLALCVTRFVFVLSCATALLSTVSTGPDHKLLAGTRTAISLLAKGSPRPLASSPSAAFNMRISQ